MVTSSHGPSKRPLDSPSTGFDFVSTLSYHVHNPSLADALDVWPTMTSADTTLLDPLTSAAKGVGIINEMDPQHVTHHVTEVVEDQRRPNAFNFVYVVVVSKRLALA